MSLRVYCPGPALRAASARMATFVDKLPDPDKAPDKAADPSWQGNVRLDVGLPPDPPLLLTAHNRRDGGTLRLPVDYAVVERPGSAVAPPRPLRDYARGAGEGGLTLESRVVVDRKSRASVECLVVLAQSAEHVVPPLDLIAADSFPHAPEPLSGPGWSIRRGLLAEAVEWCLLAADARSAESARYQFAGARLERDGAGLVLVATNGMRIHTCRLDAFDVGGPGDDEPSVARGVVPSRAWRKALGLSGDDEAPIEVRYDPDGRSVEFRSGPALLRCRLAEGRVPDWRSMVPPGDVVASVDVDDARRLLRRARQAAIVVSPEARSIELEADPATGEFAAWCEAQDVGFASGYRRGEEGWSLAGSAATASLLGRAAVEALERLGSAPVRVEFRGPRSPVTFASDRRWGAHQTIEAPGRRPLLAACRGE